MLDTPLPVLERQAFHTQLPCGELRAAESISTLQINVGLVCNLACKHCHVESSPTRTEADENMNEATVHRILDWLERSPRIETVDLTGGSPEMNPHFRLLVRGIRSLERRVMDRCNPTIIEYHSVEEDIDFLWVPEFLAEHQVEVVASLPCYLEDNVRAQRGMGAYNASIAGLLKLNEVGYGRDQELKLHLVYNPTGAHLPPAQEGLAADYHRELEERFGLVFNELWTITNMPIRRWREGLQRAGELESYMQLLIGAYNPATVDGLMCRHQVHVDSQGRLHDCDFNYALGMRTPQFREQYLWDVSYDDLVSRRIATRDHCYGCTAGAGSSCGGELI